MAEKVNSKRINSAASSSNSKRSILAGPVRVVHISNPTVIKASASEFRTVVQSLTGRKRSSASQDRDLNLYSPDLYRPQVMVPKNEDGFHTLKDMKSPESTLSNDKATVSKCCNSKNHGDVTIYEGLKIQPIQFPDYILSQYRVFETRECFGDRTQVARDIFCPSILLSEFEYL